jgi:hypothetical protein
MLLHRPIIYVKCVLQLFSDDLNEPFWASRLGVRQVRPFPVRPERHDRLRHIRQAPPAVIQVIQNWLSCISKDVSQSQGLSCSAHCSEPDGNLSR